MMKSSAAQRAASLLSAITSRGTLNESSNRTAV